jgi:HEAT repeat protein
VRRRYFIGVLILLGVTGALILWEAWSPEPSCFGRGLSAWLRDLRHPSPLVQYRAQEAVRHMGSPAVPALQAALHAQDSPLKTNLVNLLQRQTLVRIPFTPARERRIRAALACVVLGPMARPAIPDLLEFSKESAFCANLAESALGQMGEGAVGPLCVALTNTDFNVRRVAAGALVSIGPRAKAAIPGLTNCLNDEYASVRADAARALGRVGEASPGVVKLLVDAFGDLDRDVRCCAGVTVSGFGQQAVPVLSARLNDPDATVRMGVTNALKEIDAAENASGVPHRRQ